MVGAKTQKKSPAYTIVFTVALASLVLVPIIGMMYAYDLKTWVVSGAGFAILLAVAAGLWFYRRRAGLSGNRSGFENALIAGLGLGVLWMAEIAVNNFLAPPLPLRDQIDNTFWAVIALGILILACLMAYRARSALAGIAAGAWSGLVSGLLACATGLALIVFGMRLIVQDPLNLSEWAARGTGSGASSMAAYFAFEVLAGAMLHLVVLGLGMGVLLGLLGGLLGISIGLIHRMKRRN